MALNRPQLTQLPPPLLLLPLLLEPPDKDDPPQPMVKYKHDQYDCEPGPDAVTVIVVGGANDSRVAVCVCADRATRRV